MFLVRLRRAKPSTILLATHELHLK